MFGVNGPQAGHIVLLHKTFNGNKKGSIYKIKECDLCNFDEDLGEYELSISDLIPIPITSNWLKKLGFEESKYSGYQYRIFEDRYILFDKDRDVHLIDTSPPAMSVKIPKIFTHIHELQNLVIAVSGSDFEYINNMP